VLVIALLVGAMCAVVVALAPDSLAAAHAVVRWTARSSAVLLALVYVARPAVQLWPGKRTKALLARRKWLGLGFATSHAYHLAGIAAIAAHDWSAFVAGLGAGSYLGLVGFAIIAAMAITSRDDVRARMSKRAWTRLHRTGVHAFWVIFAVTYAGRVSVDPVYAAPLAAFLALAAIRSAAYLRARRRAAVREAAAA
jgi:sulfoxide reductase heme-binding subunit YedZ